MTHGVVVSPHGAGLVNEMFMVPGTGIVEIFPFHLHHNLYPNIAANMGLGYFPVHTYNGTDAWTRDKVCSDFCELMVLFMEHKSTRDSRLPF